MVRWPIIGSVIALAACGSAAKPAPPPSPRILAAPVSSIDTTRPSTRDAFRRADQAAAAVDTIIVRPDSITLHVGQMLDPWTFLTVEARDSTGAQVSGFAPFSEVSDQTIAEYGPTGLTGRRVGRTQMVLSPLALDPSVAVRPVKAVVHINVVP